MWLTKLENGNRLRSVTRRTTLLQ